MKKHEKKPKVIFGRPASFLATKKISQRKVGSKSFSWQKNWQQIVFYANVCDV